MPDIGGAIKDAIGLGLAGAKGLAEGLGLAQPQQKPGMFGSPAEYKPEDLSDLNPLQQLVVRFQNATAGAEGQPMVSHQMQERRRAANKQRTDAFGQGVKLLEDFDAIRDRASPADYDRIDGLLKKRFAELAGGGEGEADDFYDTFMSGKAGHTAAMLELARTDPGALQIIAGGGSMADLRKYMTSPEKIKEAITRADQKLLPGARNKIDAIRYGKLPPELRADIERRMKDAGGRLTLGIIGDIEDQLPESMRFTASERESLRRNEIDLADAGLQATPEVLERRKAGIDAAKQQEIDAARISEQLNADLKKLEKEAELGKFDKDRGPNPASDAYRHGASQKITKIRNAYRDHEEKLNDLLAMPYNAPGSQAVMGMFINSIDNTAAKIEEQRMLEAAAPLKDRLQHAISKITQGGAIPEATFDEIKDIARIYKRRVRGLHKEYVRDEAAAADENLGPGSADKMIRGWREFLEEPDDVQDAGGNVQTTRGATAAPGDARPRRTSDQILADLRAKRITREQARIEMMQWKEAEARARAEEAAGGQ